MSKITPAVAVRTQLVSANGSNRSAKCSCCGELKLWGAWITYVKRIKRDGSVGSTLADGRYCDSCVESGMLDLNFSDELNAGAVHANVSGSDACGQRAEAMAEHFAACRAAGVSREAAWSDWDSHPRNR